jgi:hypothetical protein
MESIGPAWAVDRRGPHPQGRFDPAALATYLLTRPLVQTICCEYMVLLLRVLLLGVLLQLIPNHHHHHQYFYIYDYNFSR